MTDPLWTLAEVIAATSATLDLEAQTTGGLAGVPPAGHGAGPAREATDITGISIDTRSLTPGDLFVPLSDARDGHDFVTNAFKAGASAALVRRTYARKPGDGALLRVDDPLRALEALGRAARDRLSHDARVIAVTGSVGKTTTKEMLRACLAPLGKTHAADKSFNNHWGVPLTLARMPADTRYAVFEIGMNHAGEITPLTKMVRPHVAIITTVEAVHLEHFASVADIAKAKAEIHAGVIDGGVAVIPRDNAHYAILASSAAEHHVKIVSFGAKGGAEIRLAGATVTANGTRVTADIRGHDITYTLATPGAHITSNSLAIVAALVAIGLDPAAALAPLAAMAAPQGRGSRTRLTIGSGQALLIDESYNANPASMRAALAVLDHLPRDQFQRRIAVLGDMLELGPDGARLHAELVDAIAANHVDLVFACGPLMRHLYEALPPAIRATWAPISTELQAPLLDAIKSGDVVMIKGSNGSRMGPLVSALVARHTPALTSD
jgi:UDP-N-acetylmuramoyl-tripeptide--D-alanyl-D-alanine ligase